MRRMPCRLALTLAVTSGVAASAPALAHAVTTAPQGNSAVSQYLEQIPSAHGGQSSTAIAASGSGNSNRPQGAAGGKGPAGPSTMRTLNSLGSAGKADAALARATAPHRSSVPSASGSESGASPATNVVNALGGSSSGGGLGPLLP